MKFKNDIEAEAIIEVQSGLKDKDNLLGSAGQLLSSTGSQVSWVDASGLSAKTAEAVVQPIKANEALSKGDPLYIVGFQAGQNVNIVAKADASNSAKMPVVGLADDDYSNQDFGTMTAFGSFNGAFDTTGGTESWSIGDIIYVKPGGGLTNVKPTGTNLIQNIAIVSRVQQNTGELEVIALGRTNDVPNLPTGRLFVGTATNTSLSSNVVYIDEANDRVGIGTASPGAKLHVDDSVGGVLRLSDTLATSDGEKIGGIETGVANGTFFAGINFFRHDANDGEIRFRTKVNNTNADVMTIVDGNVGIGTTSPGNKLHVSGGEIQVVNGGSGKLLLQNSTNFIYGDQNGVGIFNANDNLRLYTVGSEKMRITSAGNVGIGTTSPGESLEVSGNIRLGDGGTRDIIGPTNESLRILANPNSTTEGIVFSTDGGTSTEMFIQDGGNVGIGTTSPETTLSVVGATSTNDLIGGSINLATSSGWVIPSGAMSTRVGYYGGNFTLNGVVAENGMEWGLGPFNDRQLLWTTTGSTDNDADGGWNKTLTNLDIDSSYLSVVYFKRVSSNTAGSFYHGTGNNILNLNGTANTNPYFTVRTLSSLDQNVWYVSIGVIQSNSDSNTTAYTDISGLYRLDTGAKIANVNTYKFDTDGATLSRGHRAYLYYSTDVNVVAQFANPGFYKIDGDQPKLHDILGSGTDDAFWSANGDDIYNDNSGNVGIGTTSPAYPLDVSGIIKTSSSFLGTTAIIQKVTALNANGIQFTNNGGSEKMRITDGGNVGIGTATPGHLLEINGTGDALSVGDDTNTSTYMRFANERTMIGYSGADAVIQGGASKGIKFNVNNSTFNSGNAMAIIPSGNVGIGTTSPQSKLHIETGSGGTYNPNVNHDDVTIEGNGNIGLQLFSPATSYQYISFGDPDSVNAGYLRYYHGTNEMVFRTNGSDTLTIDSSGRVKTSEEFIATEGHRKGFRLVANYGNWEMIASASTNQLILHSESLNEDYLTIKGTGVVQLNDYGSGSNTGTATQKLAVDSSGNIIEIPIGGGAVDGSGTADTVTMWSDADTITDAPITISGNNATFAGSVGVGGSPGAKLDVNAGATNTVAIFESTDDKALIILKDDTTSTHLITKDNKFSIGESSTDYDNFKVDISTGDATFAGDVTATANYTAGNSKIIYKAQRSGGAVAGDWSYDDATTDMSLGTSTAHSFSLKTGNTRALTINNSQNATFAGNVSMATGNSVGKFAVMSSAVHGSYDFYNNGTSYFNGAVIVDAAFSQTGGSTSTFTGNVGIGTTSPALQSGGTGLHINAATSSELKFTNNTTGATASDGTALVSNGNNFTINNREAGAITLGTSNSTRITILSDGKVGIGTTSPNAKLDVNGDFGIQGQLFTNTGQGNANGSGVANGFAIPYRTGVTTLNNSYNYIVRLTTTGTGTDTGSYYLVGYDVAASSYYARMVSRGGNSSNHPQLAISGATMVAYHTHSGNYPIRWSCETIGTGDPDSTLHNMGADYQWQRDNDDLYYTDGNVGIGTTSPNVPLEINGANTTSGQGEGLRVTRPGLNSQYISIDEADGSKHRIRAIGNKPFEIFSNSSSYGINFSTNSTQKMTILANGNVGIGTTNTDAKLDVVRNVASYAVNLGDTDARASLKLKSSSIGDGQLTVSQGDSSSQIIQGSNAAGTSAVNINMNPFGGNVGIGTTSPVVKLHVGSTSTSTATTEEFRLQSGTSSGNGGTAIANLVTGNFGTSGIYFGNNTTYSSQPAYLRYRRSDNNTTLKFDATFNIDQGSSGTRFNINSSGNVGIGTTSPTSKLEVIGDITIDTNSNAVFTLDGAAASTEAIIIKRAGTEASRISHSNSSTLVFSTGASTTAALAIDSAQKVGIGTTSPGYKLDVSGTGRFTSTVTATNFILSSDKRKKTKIKDLTCDNIDVNWKSFELKENQGEYRTGVIAQELEEVHPEFVNTDKEGFKSVKYIDLLIAKIAELEARLEKLEK